MSSMPASLAPSARNSPPMYPQAPPHFMSIPSLDGGMMYGHMQQGPVYGMPQHIAQHAAQYMPQTMGYGWFPQQQHQQQQQQQQVIFPTNVGQMHMPAQPLRAPALIGFDTGVPHGLQGYAPLQSYQQSGFAPQHGYAAPRSGLVTPYNEPRTPYNEPRSPAAELSNWGERQVKPPSYWSL